MILKVNLNYSRDEKDVEVTSNQELTANYVYFAVKQKYKEGLDSQWRRTWARIQRKFDDAIDNKTEEIDFEQGELDFIRAAFKDAKFPPDLSKYVVILEDELERKE
jgi:2-succinyl-5-enolpyruvyl-6-hydroxy-3-cyclohexene-1-carboxylate synthase